MEVEWCRTRTQDYWNEDSNYKAGEQCLKTLAMRYFFHEVEKNNYGEIVKFKIHVLVHEFGRFVSHGSDVAYHFNLSSLSAAQIPRSKLEKLRTVVLSDSKISAPLDLDMVSSLKQVRTLSLPRSGITELPSEIGRTLLTQLPKAIQSLTRLRLLDIFVVAYDDHLVNNRVTTLASLNELKLLRVCLLIHCIIGNDEDISDAEKAKLKDEKCWK
ncbi:LRR domain containing protein [Parasponia andersonii]|uniref:LRR domain containing protein n=1 Tax=Parasponia andersonii TaxID=3476 RepID=A0A2P5C3N6_PARAD|nr:LRR domain containing protein [Parasponia andersonii]